MAIRVAPSAGFCMGVKRAVDLVLDLARKKGGEKIFTYGPLIHNPQTVELLKRRGIIAINNEKELENLPKGALIVIRAHGIPPAERNRLKERGLKIVDATCPRVGKVQGIIKKYALRDYLVVIAGDKAHPEVVGLLGYAGNNGLVIERLEDVETIPVDRPICVVSQTTQNHEKYESLVAAIKARFPEAIVFDTICDSTERRQKEVEELARDMDATVIVGGRNSANTRHLATLAARAGKPVYHVETASELPLNQLKRAENIGISAGASTPNWIIERVIEAISSHRPHRRSLAHFFFSLWTWAIKTDVYSSLGAGLLTWMACALEGIELSFFPFLIAATYVFSMHTINRFIDREASTIIGSFREEVYLRRQRLLLFAAVLSLLVSVSFSALLGYPTLILILVLLAGGLLYTIRLFPPRWKFRSFRDIPGSKNMVMATAWALVTAVIPSLAGETSFLRALIAALFVAGLVFLRSIISDLQDIQSDKFIGRETIPVLIGQKYTTYVINIVSLTLLLLLWISYLATWMPALSLFLSPIIFYLWICNRLYVRKPQFSGLIKEGLLETAYYVAGMITFAWMVWS